MSEPKITPLQNELLSRTLAQMYAESADRDDEAQRAREALLRHFDKINLRTRWPGVFSRVRR